MEPMRGEVWDACLPQPIGEHPVVLLTTNVLIPRLSAVTVLLSQETKDRLARMSVLIGTPG